MGGRDLPAPADDRADRTGDLSRRADAKVPKTAWCPGLLRLLRLGGLLGVGRPFDLGCGEIAACRFDVALNELLRSDLLGQPPAEAGEKLLDFLWRNAELPH